MQFSQCGGSQVRRDTAVQVTESRLPFSEGVLVGNTLCIAGHIGLDPKTDMPPTSAEHEAKLLMDGIKQTVESAGLSMDDVVSMQVFCTDLKY